MYTNRPMVQADASRPVTSNLFEMQGWVSGVFAEQDKGFIRNFLNRSREGSIAVPKVGGGVVVHSFVERPAR